MSGWKCRQCGEWHDELPTHYGSVAPALYFDVPEHERSMRCALSSDQCIIDDKHFFIVGNLELPVVDCNEFFSWDVWVSLSKHNFDRAAELWNTPGREREPAYFGWLCTSLPGYPTTLHIKTMVHTRPVGERPYIEIEQSDHPLSIEQRRGITLERIQQIAEMLHDEEDR
ncbi:MAG: DUF2199 domain-containing protein [Phycisphaerales bacterium]|nr:DUF2199 domain-containing protein [Phycisphaerales bacterium]